MPWVIYKDLGTCNFGDLTPGEYWSDEPPGTGARNKIAALGRLKFDCIRVREESLVPVFDCHSVATFHSNTKVWRILLRWEPEP